MMRASGHNRFFATSLLWLLLVCPFFAHAQSGRKYVLPPGKTTADIHPNQLLVKFRNGSYSAAGRTLEAAPDIDAYTIGERIDLQQLRPLDPALAGSSNSRQMPSRHLANLYKVDLSGNNALEAIDELLQYKNVLYAEPVFKEQLFVVPNDPDAATSNSKQPYLSSIKAYDAWGVTTGDSTVIIGIVDTGADYTHEDLAGNIYLNTDDPIDGVDNDGNGYVDDYRGWDFANRDSDPKSDFGDHGTHVSGLAAARTNNGKGIAGTGYKSKFVPLKAFKTEDNTSFGTYEAIIYAANQGMDVLNLSWGSIDTYSQAAQDIINYAALERNVVIVAAAGNTNAELTFYPASYDNVLSVAASTNDGTKSSFGTYSYYVDLVAPGAAVYSTRNNSTYGTGDGSSFSTPQVAGAAALLRSYFPKYSAVQIMEQLRVTGTSVDALAGNAAYKGLLGHGLLNMYRALTDTLSPSVRLAKDSLHAQAGSRVFFGDTVHYELEAINWLKPASGLEITFESLNGQATIGQGSWTSPYLATFDTTSYGLSVFVDENTPPASRVIIKAKIKASGYNDTQYFEFTTHPDSITTQSTNLSLTINSKGDLGYTKDSLKAGNGLRFENVPFVSHAGFLIGNSANNLANNAANNLVYGTTDDDFSVQKHLKQFSGTVADNYFENTFVADIADGQSALVEQKTLSWLSPEDKDFLITEYRITNASADTLPNLHAGLFTNWDIGNGNANRTQWVDSLDLGLTYMEDAGMYGGIALLSGSTPTFYAADIDNLNGNVAVTDSLLTDSLKFAWLSSDFVKTTAGQTGVGNNTAQMNGVNMGKLPGYGSQKIAFAWVAGGSPDDIIAAVQQARARYVEFTNSPRTIATFLACEASPVTISLGGGTNFDFFADAAATDTLLIHGNDYITETVTSPVVIYARNSDNNYMGELFAVKINIDDVTAAFSISEDTVLLEPDFIPIVSLNSESEKAVEWDWNFGNGTQSHLENPQTKFTQPGKYELSLTTTSKSGCTATSTSSVLVANRALLPIFDPIAVCFNEAASIQAANASKIRVFIDSLSVTPVFEGNTFPTGLLTTDTSFYVTNADSLFESRRVKVEVKQNQPLPGFTIAPDTTAADQAVLLINQSSNANTYEWYVNETLVSENTNGQFLLGGETSVTVKLIATNDQGCTGSVDTALSFGPSASPTVSDLWVCPGETAVVAPGGGSYFLFKSAASGQVLHKGKTYEIEQVTDTVRLVVQGIDNIIESDPVEVSVFPFDLSAQFEVDPAVLILKKQKTATFTSTASGATSWQWHINGTLIDISKTPTLAFDSAGLYNVTLIAGNNQGCSDTLSIAYQVLEVTGVPTAFDIFKLFPNPAGGSFYIELKKPQNDVKLSITNLAGQEVFRQRLNEKEASPQEINITMLPAGIYSVRLSSGSESWQQRLIKK